MANDDPALHLLARKFAAVSALDEADRSAILALPVTVMRAESGSYLIREGETPKRCMLILSGFAFRQKLTKDGARQILALHLRGDFIDLQNMFLNIADHNVQALSRVELATIERGAMQTLALSRPNLARALWSDALIEASVFREWIVNVGRRDARARVAHILCEFVTRAKNAGLVSDGIYELPMTQEQIADAVGLTPVHVNRTLRQLMDDGLIERDRRRLRVREWDKLAAAGDFSPRYLHLDQGGPEGI